MLREGEYDYACTCLNRALLIRIDGAGGAHDEPHLAEGWYLHGSALLRRAQAMRLRVVAAAEAAAAEGGGSGS
eukprot:5614418-Prymnesium_polylepis.1